MFQQLSKAGNPFSNRQVFASAGIITLLLCSSMAYCSRAEEDLSTQAANYLKGHSTPLTDAAWEQAFHRRAADAMATIEWISDESTFAGNAVLEFFIDRRKSFDSTQNVPLTQKDKVTMARWYMLFAKNGWRLPAKIAPYLTKSNYESYIATAE